MPPLRARDRTRRTVERARNSVSLLPERDHGSAQARCPSSCGPCRRGGRGRRGSPSARPGPSAPPRRPRRRPRPSCLQQKLAQAKAGQEGQRHEMGDHRAVVIMLGGGLLPRHPLCAGLAGQTREAAKQASPRYPAGLAPRTPRRPKPLPPKRTCPCSRPFGRSTWTRQDPGRQGQWHDRRHQLRRRDRPAGQGRHRLPAPVA